MLKVYPVSAYENSEVISGQTLIGLAVGIYGYSFYWLGLNFCEKMFVIIIYESASLTEDKLNKYFTFALDIMKFEKV